MLPEVGLPEVLLTTPGNVESSHLLRLTFGLRVSQPEKGVLLSSGDRDVTCMGINPSVILWMAPCVAAAETPSLGWTPRVASAAQRGQPLSEDQIDAVAA